ncbi:MAG: hypothetical protein A2298_03235 [Gammaproteobacteria bacterium RIFOXYB2_FULL_38_6]|nr:MAG: hypothetical protein A2298_03235 [Gammaproteobacteria bacterium RIFOXYB2_FULL_38_6]
MKRTDIFLILCLISISAWASTGQTHPSVLKQILNKIENVKSDIVQAASKKSHLQSSLKQTETSLAELEHQMDQTRHSLKAQQKILSDLQQKTKQNQHHLDTEREALTVQLRAAYISGRQPYLKLLLNEEDPNKLGRMLIYYRYINKDRIDLINTLLNTLQQIEQTQEQIEVHTNALHDLENQQIEQEKKLNKTTHTRQQVISQIDASIQTKKQKLDQLIQNKENLEATIKKLNESKIYFQTEGKSFLQLRGHLPWPTRGNIIEPFGQTIANSQLKTDGVLIQTPNGQAVYALASGKVIFAHWVTGYGLLLIIDHGNGYMTLFGRNTALYKNVGDIVHAGDLIATVGNSGGYATASLYFAIRYNGKPINPSNWCRKM